MVFSCKTKNHTANSSSSPQEPKRLFEILTPQETGINFENKLPESFTMDQLTYLNFNNGAGVAVADFNNDGLQDVFFLSTLGRNKLYLNKGNLSFKDVSEESGTDNIAGFHTGVTTVDINSDGWMDIYICNAGPYMDPEMRKNKLLVNQGLNKEGIPTFKEESSKYGLDIDLCSTQAVFFDYDRDGDLDMFLINASPDMNAIDFRYLNKNLKTESNITGDRLYENRNGKFFDVSKKAGLINNSLIMSLGVGVSDLNNDGWPDIYVSNDFLGKDALYLNNKNGTFTECINESLNHISYSSMGNDLADFNNDGWTDIITLDMQAEDNYNSKTSYGSMNLMNFQQMVNLGLHYQYPYNTLQLNNGIIAQNQKPSFSDIAQIAGISATDWSWGPLLFDMDNDGNKDLFVSNGYKQDYLNYDFAIYFRKKIEELAKSGQLGRNSSIYNPTTLGILNQMPQRKKNNYFFRNNGDLTFEKMNGVWSNDFLTCSNGAAYADFDNDGDMDIVVNNTLGISFIYKNNCREKGLGNYIQFNLIGPRQNPLGIGTKIILKQATRIQVLEQYLTRGFQSSVSPILHFGLGSDTIVPEIQVIWPDGKEQVITNIPCNQRKNLYYKEANQIHNFSFYTPSLFTDITKKMNLHHKHEENKINNIVRESLLPHKMSDLGPAMAVGDVNNDGMDDFYIGGAKGYSGKLYFQTSGGTFEALGNQPWSEDKDCEDVGAVFFDANNDGLLDLYVVSGSDEFEEGSQYLQDRLYLNVGSNNFIKAKGALPSMIKSGSCVRAGDYDGDGYMDLFVGGRQRPGKYPLPASSFILRNESKSGTVKFKDVTSEIAPQLKNIGMVTDANWTDINNDGKLDLLIVGEWMSPKVFKNCGNVFKDVTVESGLSQDIGWWNCITSADFNQDGNMDFVAGNLGLNYKYKASKNRPFEIYAKDFDNNGTLDLVLGYYYGETLYPLYGRDRSAEQCPFILQKFPSYDAYGKATLQDIYGAENLQSALNYKATNFSTCYFENKGNGTFKIHPLKNLAQISSTNSIIAEDIDGDGLLDLVIAGNMYGSDVDAVRNDASIGLFLKGDGAGNFEPVVALKSGLFIKGEVRQIAIIHLGQDKTRNILVAKNNDFMQLIKINDEKAKGHLKLQHK
jgi:hypothetical protein